MGPKNAGPVEARLSRVEDTVERLDEFVFRTPNIERRMEAFIDGRIIDRKAQTDQSLLLLQDVVNRNEERTVEFHRQNSRKLDRLTWLAGVGVGIILTLQAVLLGKH